MTTNTTANYIELIAGIGKELFNGIETTNRISAPIGTDLSMWVEQTKPIEIIVDSKIKDGKEFYFEVINKLSEIYQNGRLTNTQFNTLATSITTAVLPLVIGLWKLAQTRVNALAVTTGVSDRVRLIVKERIDKYVSDNSL